MAENRYGTEKHGKLIAVVDYSNKVKQFSKVLTKQERKAFDETGAIPFGVTVKTVYEVVETFSTKQEADVFIAKGCDKKPESSTGIFKSKAQYRLAKKLVSGK